MDMSRDTQCKRLGTVQRQRLPGVKKGNPYSITKRRVLELIPVLGSQLAGDTQTQSTEGKAVDVNHKSDVRLPLLFTRPAVTPAQWV